MYESENIVKIAVLDAGNAELRVQVPLIPLVESENVALRQQALVRDIRNVNFKLKVSDQFKTVQEHFCILRSIIDTTIKNDKSVFDAIAAIAHLPSPSKAVV